MDAKEFINNYVKLAPSINDFRKINVNDQFIQDELNRFNISILKNYNFSNDLWNLAKSYEVNKINIADIQLGYLLEETESFYYVGIFEGVDRIVVEKVSNFVKILRSETSLELFLCAIDSSSFLEALLVMAEYFIKCMINEDLYNNQEYRKDVCEKCIELAGGMKFREFYKYIFIIK